MKFHHRKAHPILAALLALFALYPGVYLLLRLQFGTEVKFLDLPLGNENSYVEIMLPKAVPEQISEFGDVIFYPCLMIDQIFFSKQPVSFGPMLMNQ